MDARETLRREARRCRAMAGVSAHARDRWLDAARRYDDAASLAVIAEVVAGQAAEVDRMDGTDPGP